MPRLLRGTALAALVAVVGVAYQHRRHEDPHIIYTRFDLPAFDAYAYMAMADHPAFFTVAPWGYRVLTPWLVKGLSFRNTARSFRWVTLASLTLAGCLLFVYLRRLGSGEIPALLATLFFVLSDPVSQAVRYGFLVDPLTVLLEVAFLLVLQAGGGRGVLAVLATLGTLSKEFFLLLIPLVYLDRRRTRGDLRGLFDAALVALPAVCASLVLRFWWTPHLPAFQGLAFGLVTDRVRDSWREWLPAVFLSGVTPLAVVGALRRRARPLVLASGYVFLATIVPPCVNPVAFFPQDIPRLLVYALPAVLPLALFGLDVLWPHFSSPMPPWRVRPRLEMVAAAIAASLAAWPLFATDTYKRADLRGPRDGPLLLSVCRETLRTATRLARGDVVTFESERQKFVWGVSDPGELHRVRWFLREGWGPLPHYGTRDVQMRATRAAILVPLFEPREMQVGLEMDAPAENRLQAFMNGESIGFVVAGASPTETILRAPANALFRGDNLLVLVQTSGTLPGPRLRKVTLRLSR